MREKEEAGRMDRSSPIMILTTVCLLAFLLILSGSGAAQEPDMDTDSDGLPDSWEDPNGLNVTDPSDAHEDPDNDGLDNTAEYQNGTDPQDPDTDSDGMPDGWEVENDLYPTNHSSDNDEDNDGFTDLQEYLNGSDPNDRNEPDPGNDDDDDSPVCEDSEDNDGATFCIFYIFILAVGAIVFFIIIGIYSKIKKDRLLDHETRQRIMDFIKANPGTYYSQMRKELDVAHGVLTHHINMLETQELIFSKQDRQYRRFYADGLYKDAPMVTGQQKRVLDEIRRYPGLSQKQVSEHLDLYPMMVSYHVGQLENLGLVRKKKEGRSNLLYAVTKPAEEKDEIMGRGPFEGPAPEMVIAEN